MAAAPVSGLRHFELELRAAVKSGDCSQTLSIISKIKKISKNCLEAYFTLESSISFADRTAPTTQAAASVYHSMKAILLNQPDHAGHIPVDVAVNQNNLNSFIKQRIETLIEKSQFTSPERRFDNQNTMLLSAVSTGNKEAVDFIISNERLCSELLELRDKDGRTPLLLAAMQGDITIFKALLAAGAKIDATDKNKKNGLHLCAEADQEAGHKNIAELLCTNKALIDAKDDCDLTPIIYAAYSERFDIWEVLIRAGAIPNIKGLYESTALHTTLKLGKLDILPLIAQHQDLFQKMLNSPNKKEGETPVFLTLANIYPEACKFLLASGADPSSNDLFRMFYMPFRPGRVEILEALANHMISKGKKNVLAKVLQDMQKDGILPYAPAHQILINSQK